MAPDSRTRTWTPSRTSPWSWGSTGIIATTPPSPARGSAMKVRPGAGGRDRWALRAPLKERSLEVLSRLYARVGTAGITWWGVGGVESAEDAWQRILAGATLVQGYSAFHLRGPLLRPGRSQGALAARPSPHPRTPPSPRPSGAETRKKAAL
nr:hypothetical protein [Streptomyces sp. CYG21]